ncbi:TonB-dependent receptor domain-containing protein [Cellvibrio sp. OA-2007]|uniref:TonB-dependent receptor domain-containing protein n=1 Tax=Cellvibrio sp. OA-2007 TaxID=529823 RepID=UPI001EE6D082|nr:TonB-dependent receptor [Cellvibrio sp. OA-2007]
MRKRGGSFGITTGLDYDEFRTDFEYGGELTDTIYFHVGGFYRNGEGVRETGFNGDNGGQIKVNLTKELDNGFIRVYAKSLNDKVTTYLPAPVMVKGSGSYGAVPGFDASTDALQSSASSQITTFDAYGNAHERSVRDGIESKVNAFGFEFDNEIGDGLVINNKFRRSSITGGFISPFTDGFAGGTDTVANKGAALCAQASVGGVSIDCSGGVVATVNGKTANPNDLAFTNLMFDTKFEDLGLTVNDLRLTKSFDAVTVTGGYYFSQQNIDTAWESWHTRMQVLGTGENIHYVAKDAGIDAQGNPIDLVLANQGALTQSFLAWDWDLDYTTTAPYLNVAFEVSDDFSFDMSVRRDEVQARGVRLDGCCGGNTSVDLNGNGSIGQFSVANGVITRLDSDALMENANATSAGFIAGGVRVLNETNAAVTRVNYDASNTSYSIGGTYLLNDNSSVFARYSDGGRAVADRLTQVAGSLNANGSLSATMDGYDNVQQLEVGYKLIADDWSLFATVFNTITEETNAEITSGVTFVREYEATGLELEGKYQINDYFSLRGNTTWSDAEITKDKTNAAVVGNAPRRQADFIWTVAPEFSMEDFTVGLALQGTTDFYLQDNNDLKQNGYNLVNLYASWNISEQLTTSLNVNNLTNEFALTEAEEGSAAVGSIIRGRPVSGRSMSLGLRYNF